jgi:hypothetical protein
MELLTKKVPLDFNYFLMGDAHMGSIFHHKEGWNQFVDMVHSKIDGLKPSRNLICEHGDDCDFIDPKDSRFDAATDKMMILQQIEYAKRERSAIKDHYVCKLMGNHEYAKISFGDIMDHICKALGVRYGGWSCIITFKNSRGGFLFKHYATHGKTGISSAADDPKRRRTNKLLSLKRKLKNKSGSCILQSRGHTHWCDRLKPETDVYFSDDGKQVWPQNIATDAHQEYIHPDLRWYVSTGSFYRPYGVVNEGVQSYAERSDYDPLRASGFQIAKVRNGVITEIEPVWID